MSPLLINLGALPGHDMEPETIRSGAVRLRSAGSEVETASARVVKTWHRLDHVYEAPESGLLLAAMDPVKSSGAMLSEHFGSAASALETFAGEVETIKQAVAAIQADALTFFATIRGGKSTVTVHSTRDGDTTKQVDWWDDPDAARQNNALLDRVTAQAELLSAAEDRCSATLMGLADGVFPGSENGGPGYWNGPPAWVENPPWGAPVRIPELFEDPLGRAVKKLGAETVAGLAGLAGYDTSGYHYDLDKTLAEQDPMWTGGRTWARTGTALMGLATFIGNLNPGTELANITSRLVTGQPGAWDGEKAKLAFVKGFVASGDWKDHPAEAFFETAINVASLPISWSKLGKVGDVSRITAETSDAARAAAEAGKASEALRLARAAARGTDRIALPTVDGWKALDKGPRLDTAWAKNIDKIDVEIKVPDHGVKVDRPNVPHDDAGAPKVHEAPAARPDGQSSNPGPAVVSGRGTREPALVGAPEHPGSAGAKPDVSAARPLDADTAGPRVRTDGTETAEVAKTGSTSHLGQNASLDAPPQPVRDSAPGVTHGHGDSPAATHHSTEGGIAGHSPSSSDGLNGSDHSPFGHDDHGPGKPFDSTPPHETPTGHDGTTADDVARARRNAVRDTLPPPEEGKVWDYAKNGRTRGTGFRRRRRAPPSIRRRWRRSGRPPTTSLRSTTRSATAGRGSTSLGRGACASSPTSLVGSR